MRWPNSATMATMFVLLNAVDCFLTQYGITYHEAVEMNPLMKGLIALGLPTFVIVKMTAGTIIGFWMGKNQSRILPFALTLIGATVGWNILILIARFLVS